ncbi:class I SAM-dependent methyltransferase [Lonsdalea quercina]|uniref:class I SAM-dependent methyltransferase n=1 Tax=Lonsdalea quercina TaxID=71657 RepID=UPI0039750311
MKPAQTVQTVEAPDAWDSIPWGTFYRDTLDDALQPWWPKIFGFHLLKVGALSAEMKSAECAIPHQINLTSNRTRADVIADPCQLPFVEKSVDACLLIHALAYSSDPHRVLREVDRVLINDGWLIISGFNPMSLMGLGKMVPGIRHRQPYCSRMFSQMRLQDWLNLLNYEIVHHASLHALPWRQQGQGRWNNHLPLLGCLNLIVARKRTVPLTPTLMRSRLKKAPMRSPVGATKSYRRGPD